MNIEEAIKYIKNDIEIDKDTASWFEKGNKTKEQIEESINAYETLLTAYEKEKEKNKELSNSYDKLAKECNEENRRCMLLAVENQDLKDKIKAKIEYLLKRYDSEEDFCSYDVLISILKSLLEKE